IDAERMQPALLGLRAFHQHADRGAVGELACVARAGESARTLYRRQREEPFQSGAGAVAFVAIKRDLLARALAGLLVIEALGNSGGDDLAVETSGLLRGEGSLLTLERILVLSFAGDLVALRDDLRGIDHRHVHRRRVLEDQWIALAVCVHVRIL